MSPKLNLMQMVITAFILSFVILCNGKNCHDDPVVLNEELFACCKGHPKYTSEPCIDALLANDTFSPECLVDCMYSQYKIYNGEDIDLAAVKIFLDSRITDEAFNVVYLHAYKKCSKLNKALIESKFSFIEIKNSHGCDVYPTFMEFCVWYHTIVDCPPKYATNDETCSHKRQWINECLLES
uniref:Odorant-binding protein 17 n=1 Tax=Delia platura TaxID=81723 RepID=A0A0P0UVL5_9MUSC|nr:odorant-binding protein 17 [Delia platura]